MTPTILERGMVRIVRRGCEMNYVRPLPYGIVGAEVFLDDGLVDHRDFSRAVHFGLRRVSLPRISRFETPG